jgi:hypothetical protein
MPTDLNLWAIPCEAGGYLGVGKAGTLWGRTQMDVIERILRVSGLDRAQVFRLN